MKTLINLIIFVLLVFISLFLYEAPKNNVISNLTIKDSVVLGRDSAGATRADEKHVQITKDDINQKWFITNVSKNKKLLITQEGKDSYVRETLISNGKILIADQYFDIRIDKGKVWINVDGNLFVYDGYCLRLDSSEKTINCNWKRKIARFFNQYEELVLNLGGQTVRENQLAIPDTPFGVASLIKRSDGYYLATRFDKLTYPISFIPNDDIDNKNFLGNKMVELQPKMIITFGYSSFLVDKINIDTILLRPLTDKLKYKNIVDVNYIDYKVASTDFFIVDNWKPLLKAILLSFIAGSIVFFIITITCKFLVVIRNDGAMWDDRVSFEKIKPHIFSISSCVILTTFSYLFPISVIKTLVVLGLFLFVFIQTKLLCKKQFNTLSIPFLCFALWLCGFVSLFFLEQWFYSDINLKHFTRFLTLTIVALFSVSSILVLVNIAKCYRFSMLDNSNQYKYITALLITLFCSSLFFLGAQALLGSETGIWGMQPIEILKSLFAVFIGLAFTRYRSFHFNCVQRQRSKYLFVTIMIFILAVFIGLFMAHDNSPILLIGLSLAVLWAFYDIRYCDANIFTRMLLGGVSIVAIGITLSSLSLISPVQDILITSASIFLPSERIDAFIAPEFFQHSSYQVSKAQHYISEASASPNLVYGKGNFLDDLPASHDDFAIVSLLVRGGVLVASIYMFLVVLFTFKVTQVAFSLLNKADNHKVPGNFTDKFINQWLAFYLLFSVLIFAGHLVMNLFSCLSLGPVIGQPIPLVSAGGSFYICYVVVLMFFSSFAEIRNA